jgi:GH24 family phage-related lysozyme (muramidase)
MMATPQVGLFGGMGTPEEMQRQLVEQRATQFANMSPQQQMSYNIYKNTGNLGRGLAGAFGVDVQDPAVRQATMLRQLASQFDTNTPEGLKQMAQALQSTNPELGLQVMQRAQTMEEQMAKTKGATAEAQKKELTVQQEAALRNELANLGPDATQEDILKAVTKYGSADKVMSVLQSAADKNTQREQAAQLQRDRIEAQVQAQRERLDAQIQTAKDRNATAKEIAQLQIDGRRAFAASLKASNPKPLPASLQKSEDDDLTKVDAAFAQSEALNPVIQALTPNEQGKRLLELSPGKVAGYVYQNSMGKSSPESRAYAQLKEAVGAAVNIKTSAEKGVQTDKDVLRFADALIAASGRFDSKATFDALQRFNEANLKDQERIQKRINSRRVSQGVEPYYPSIGTPKQSNKPETTPSVDPATLRKQATDAIAKGADPAAVKARFKQITNQEF